MDIAYTIAPGKGDTDLLLHGFARSLMAQGIRVCGAVQVNSESCGTGLCDMDVKVLPTGPEIRISQNLGPAARGCRLDPDALEQVVGLVSARLHKGANLLIVNKFGKHEAGGRGFRPVIAEALSLGIPVLVGLNTLNLEAFSNFSSGLARCVPPHSSALGAWFEGLETEFGASA